MNNIIQILIHLGENQRTMYFQKIISLPWMLECRVSKELETDEISTPYWKFHSYLLDLPLSCSYYFWEIYKLKSCLTPQFRGGEGVHPNHLDKKLYYIYKIFFNYIYKFWIP